MRLPPPPFFKATTETLRSSCLASFLTMDFICLAFACSLISGVFTSAIADPRSFSIRFCSRFFFRARASATFRMGRALISRSLSRYCFISSLEMGSSGLLNLSSSSVNQTGRASSRSKIQRLKDASMMSIRDFLESTSTEPRARVSASSWGSDGLCGPLEGTRGCGASKGTTSRGFRSSSSTLTFFPNFSSLSCSFFRFLFLCSLSVSGRCGSLSSLTSLILSSLSLSLSEPRARAESPPTVEKIS
mmetsp:Transcript_46314/g.122985  ORF Transcript_46314/g.122985 Transcript_46314/m.122985 type:complete len:246 (-) Transcript_46314:2128-2865(-)